MTYYGHKNTLGNWNTFGHRNTFGYENTLGDWNTLGDGNTFGDENTLGNWNTFGDGNTFGHRNTFGYENTFGDGNTLGNWNTLGDGLKFGKKFSIEGVRVLALMCMSNVDGSGRKIQVIVHTKGILIRAGCFRGTLDEFWGKARAEGKVRYMRVVRAAAEALAADVAERGITGGWNE